MKHYHFSCGNSTKGIVGLCAEIIAETPERALQELRVALENALGPLGACPVYLPQSNVKYVNFYVNPDYLGVCEIEEQERRDPVQ